MFSRHASREETVFNQSVSIPIVVGVRFMSSGQHEQQHFAPIIEEIDVRSIDLRHVRTIENMIIGTTSESQIGRFWPVEADISHTEYS